MGELIQWGDYKLAPMLGVRVSEYGTAYCGRCDLQLMAVGGDTFVHEGPCLARKQNGDPFPKVRVEREG